MGGRLLLPRSVAMKATWRYVKARHLQDPADGRRILCGSDALARVLGAPVATLTELPGMLARHLSPAACAPAAAAPRPACEGEDEPVLRPSRALAEVLRTVAPAGRGVSLTRRAALRELGCYIEAHALRDPNAR